MTHDARRERFAAVAVLWVLWAGGCDAEPPGTSERGFERGVRAETPRVRPADDVEPGRGVEPSPLCPSAAELATALDAGPPTAARRTRLSLAKGCPSAYQGPDILDRPDIDVASCHTRFVACGFGEGDLACAKRALKAGDWELAVEKFDRAPDSCEASYGRYLARLLRLYADFNNRFYEVYADGSSCNQDNMARALALPLTAEGRDFENHQSCLVDENYHARDSLLDRYLEEVWNGDCRLASDDGSALPVRWVQGRCEAPAMDTVLVGEWDRVDAVMVYQFLFGSPATTKRGINLLRGSATGPCEGRECEVVTVDGVRLPRLSTDAEWFLGMLDKATGEIFNPARGSRGVHVWTDADGDGAGSLGDRVELRACDTATGRPTYDLSRATLGAVAWDYRRAPAPREPSPRGWTIYLNVDGSEPTVYPEDGETLLREPPPPWLILFGEGNTGAAPSPDGRKLAFGTRDAEGRRQIHVADNELDTRGRPVCSEPDGDCCVTCASFPTGVHGAGPEGGDSAPVVQWIADPTDPGGEALGIMFQANEHPSSQGWEGQAQGPAFFAMHADGSDLTALLPDYPVHAFQYVAHVAPDGSKLFWSSTWDPATGTVGSHHLLIGDLGHDDAAGRFTLTAIHPVEPAPDHGWWEANSFAPDFPADPRLCFTNGSHSMQGTEVYCGTLSSLGPDGALVDIVKLSHPGDASAGAFRPDSHPGWNEHVFLVDGGRQAVFLGVAKPSAPDRFDWVLQYPPVLDGVLYGLTPYTVRFVGFYPVAYVALTVAAAPLGHVIENVDGTDRAPLYAAPFSRGWSLAQFTTSPVVRDGLVYAVQKKVLHEHRYAAMRFGLYSPASRHARATTARETK